MMQLTLGFRLSHNEETLVKHIFAVLNNVSIDGEKLKEVYVLENGCDSSVISFWTVDEPDTDVDPRTTEQIKEDNKKKIALLVERYLDELMENAVTYEEDFEHLEHVISIQQKLSQ